MRKSQKITIVIIAFVEALVLFFYEAIDICFYEWFDFWQSKDTPALFMLFILFLGFGIWVLLGLKNKKPKNK